MADPEASRLDAWLEAARGTGADPAVDRRGPEAESLGMGGHLAVAAARFRIWREKQRQWAEEERIYRHHRAAGAGVATASRLTSAEVEGRRHLDAVFVEFTRQKAKNQALYWPHFRDEWIARNTKVMERDSRLGRQGAKAVIGVLRDDDAAVQQQVRYEKELAGPDGFDQFARVCKWTFYAFGAVCGGFSIWSIFFS